MKQAVWLDRFARAYAFWFRHYPTLLVGEVIGMVLAKWNMKSQPSALALMAAAGGANFIGVAVIAGMWRLRRWAVGPE